MITKILKKKKTPFGIDEENEIDDHDHEMQMHNDTKMDWNDVDSVNRIKELIKKLLSSSNLSKGIKEEELYLMFSSPSPSEIIQQLRFGILDPLCDVHIDRFGRRSYYYRRNRHQRQKSQIHFYNHSNVPSSIMSAGDVVGLSDFIEEDIESVASDRESRTSIAKIHYHDNDFVLTESPAKTGNGKMETQIQWQNYAIHSYLYRRTRFAHQPSMSNSSNSNESGKGHRNSMPLNIPIAKPIVPFNPNVSNSRTVAQYGVSITPRKYGSRPHISDRVAVPGLSGLPPLPARSYSASKKRPNSQKSTYSRSRNKNVNKNGQNVNTVNDRKHARGTSPFTDDIDKEGFLEKQQRRSSSNIINKQWTKYWCVLWNTDLFLYRKRRREVESQKPVEVINLDSLSLPIPKRTDMKNGYFEFRLNTIVSDHYHIFRTRTQFQQTQWVHRIESKLSNDKHCKDRLGMGYPTTRLNEDKSSNSCLIM